MMETFVVWESTPHEDGWLVKVVGDDESYTWTYMILNAETGEVLFTEENVIPSNGPTGGASEGEIVGWWAEAIEWANDNWERRDA